MSRKHVEFVKDEELEWRTESVSSQLPELKNKLLSVDDETGAFTRLVTLPDDWEANSVTFPTVQELFVIEGQIVVDDHELKANSYLRIPPTAQVESVVAEETTQLLWTSDSALEAGSDHDGHRFWTAPESTLTHVDATALDWEQTEKEGPEEGLLIKYLWFDEETNAASFLAKADEWTEPRQEHHNCVETCYTLSGGMQLGERGALTAGDYFWRPPWVRHGPMETLEDGFEAFMRVDGPLVNHYTSADGVPLNY